MTRQQLRDILETSLQEHFPNIWLEVSDIESACPENLLPEELHWIEKAYQGRKKEFTAGRIAARKAIKRSGLHPCSIPSSKSRLPLFPKERLGSITHNKKWAIAAVAIPRKIFSLGIDLESRNRLSRRLWNSVFTQSEQTYLNTLTTDQSNLQATIYFSAKEAFYKAQYFITHQFLGFQDASVEIINNYQIQLTLRPDLYVNCLHAKRWSGYYCILEDTVFTLFGNPD